MNLPEAVKSVSVRMGVGKETKLEKEAEES